MEKRKLYSTTHTITPLSPEEYWKEFYQSHKKSKRLIVGWISESQEGNDDQYKR